MESRRFAAWCLLLCVLSCALPAQDPTERESLLCDPADPENQCPGDDCTCLPDTLEITFDGDTASVLQYDSFAKGLEIQVTVVMDVKTAGPEPGKGIQGWAYGVAHDPEALALTEVTNKGTVSDVPCPVFAFFDAFDCEPNWQDVETCKDGLACKDRAPGGGWISAVVLSLTSAVSLPLGRHPIARATYTLEKDVGLEGTLIELSDRLAHEKSPRSDIHLTMNGLSRKWTTGVNGWVRKRSGDAVAFLRGDMDGNGRIGIVDVLLVLGTVLGDTPARFDCQDIADTNDDGSLTVVDVLPLLVYAFQHGPVLPPPFPACGVDPTADGLGCEEPTNCSPR